MNHDLSREKINHFEMNFGHGQIGGSTLTPALKSTVSNSFTINHK